MRFTVTVGTLPLPALLAALRARGVQQNAYAERLCDGFVSIAPSPRELTLEVHEVGAFGPAEGATMERILAAAAGRGLTACPLEAALQLRLGWLDQPIGRRVTVASPRPTPDQQEPRGLYLRRDETGPWLRGYVASDDWLFDPTELIALALRHREV